MEKKIRLSNEEIKIIKETAREIFGEGVKVFIFGSRTDLKKRGGDIDIFIQVNKNIPSMLKLEFLVELEKKGIERKVDLILETPLTKRKSIHREAREKGVLL